MAQSIRCPMPTSVSHQKATPPIQQFPNPSTLRRQAGKSEQHCSSQRRQRATCRLQPCILQPSSKRHCGGAGGRRSVGTGQASAHRQAALQQPAASQQQGSKPATSSLALAEQQALVASRAKCQLPSMVAAHFR
uniref:Uncharacterized protein n=1 Tax=Oryza punctata TaxID=4537 RepID=A0A0E0KTI4_ORYPU